MTMSLPLLLLACRGTGEESDPDLTPGRVRRGRGGGLRQPAGALAVPPARDEHVGRDRVRHPRGRQASGAVSVGRDTELRDGHRRDRLRRDSVRGHGRRADDAPAPACRDHGPLPCDRVLLQDRGRRRGHRERAHVPNGAGRSRRDRSLPRARRLRRRKHRGDGRPRSDDAVPGQRGLPRDDGRQRVLERHVRPVALERVRAVPAPADARAVLPDARQPRLLRRRKPSPRSGTCSSPRTPTSSKTSSATGRPIGDRSISSVSTPRIHSTTSPTTSRTTTSAIGSRTIWRRTVAPGPSCRTTGRCERTRSAAAATRRCSSTSCRPSRSTRSRSCSRGTTTTTRGSSPCRTASRSTRRSAARPTSSPAAAAPGSTSIEVGTGRAAGRRARRRSTSWSGRSRAARSR